MRRSMIKGISKAIVLALVLSIGYNGNISAASPDDPVSAQSLGIIPGENEETSAQSLGIGEEVPDVTANENVEQNEIIVVMQENRNAADLEVQAKDEILEEIPLSEQVAVTVSMEGTSEEMQQKIEEYESNPDVKYVQNNYAYEMLGETGMVSRAAASNDPGSPSQWYLNSKCNISSAWSLITSPNRVRVAVIDSGVKLDHPDLRANINASSAYDFAAGSSGLVDRTGHGTHVAGIVGGVTNNGVGIAGVANNNIEMLCYGVFRYNSASGKWLAYTSDIYKAFNQAVNAGAKVVNMSLGGYLSGPEYFENKNTYDYVLKDAITKATQRGIVVVCAAGNENSTQFSFPSDIDEVISVVAVDKSYNKASFSDHNRYKDIAAPGVSIYSTSSQGSYMWMYGTSMAAPIVSGVAALMFAANPNLTTDQVKKIMYNTATDLGPKGWDENYGWGLINAEACVQEAIRQGGKTGITVTQGMEVSAQTAQSAIIPGSVLNITGRNRTDTSILLAEQVKKIYGASQFQTIILASGMTFPDGLGGSALSNLLNAPVIIYTSGTESTIKNYLYNSLASDGSVIILGGSGAIPYSFENTIKGFTTVRRLGGSNRYDTNLRTLEEAVRRGISKDEIIIVSGKNSADALSASATGKAIMIVGDSLTPGQRSFLQSQNFSKVTILGGAGAVSAAVESELTSITKKSAVRFGGKNRIETSYLVANNYYPSSGCSVYTKADGFADGLSGGLLANTLGAPMVLTYSASDRTSGGKKIYVGGIK